MEARGGDMTFSSDKRKKTVNLNSMANENILRNEEGINTSQRKKTKRMCHQQTSS